MSAAAARRRAAARLLATLLLIGAPAAAAACVPMACPREVPMDVSGRIDAELRRAIEAAPDSTVGVLLRAERTIGNAERRELARAGLRLGTVAAELATGRLRACDALRVAALDFVRYVELARAIPPSAPPPGEP